jgi:hypothetical protein
MNPKKKSFLQSHFLLLFLYNMDFRGVLHGKKSFCPKKETKKNTQKMSLFPCNMGGARKKNFLDKMPFSNFVFYRF